MCLRFLRRVAVGTVSRDAGGSGLGCVGALMLPNAQKSVANTTQSTAAARAVYHEYHLLAYCCR